jgi:hypothetical protein
MKRPVHPATQAAARERIASQGLEPAAASIRVSAYLLAKAALGAQVAELSAEAIERRLAAADSAA